MKIFRGAHSGDEVTLTDEQDLSKDNGAWAGSKNYVLNNTIEKNPERKSIVNIELSEDDIMALHEGLQLGRTAEVARLREIVDIYESALVTIRRRANLQKLSKKENFIEEIASLSGEALARVIQIR